MISFKYVVLKTIHHFMVESFFRILLLFCCCCRMSNVSFIFFIFIRTCMYTTVILLVDLNQKTFIYVHLLHMGV